MRRYRIVVSGGLFGKTVTFEFENDRPVNEEGTDPQDEDFLTMVRDYINDTKYRLEKEKQEAAEQSESQKEIMELLNQICKQTEKVNPYEQIRGSWKVSSIFVLGSILKGYEIYWYNPLTLQLTSEGVVIAAKYLPGLPPHFLNMENCKKAAEHQAQQMNNLSITPEHIKKEEYET